MKSEPWKAIELLALVDQKLWELLTRNHVAGIHGILVLNESKPIHELDLSDLSCTMGIEMGFDIRLGRCVTVSLWTELAHILISGRIHSHYTVADREIGGLPLRGRLPRYKRVEDTSVMLAGRYGAIGAS